MSADPNLRSTPNFKDSCMGSPSLEARWRMPHEPQTIANGFQHDSNTLKIKKQRGDLGIDRWMDGWIDR